MSAGPDAASKSRVEIAAANNLRKLYDALLDESADADSNVHATHTATNTPSQRQRPRSAQSPASSAHQSIYTTSTIASSSRIGRPSGSVDTIRLLRRQPTSRGATSLLTTPSTSIARPQQQQRQVRRSDASATFTRWLDLTTTAAALETDAAELKREVVAAERRCVELQELEHALLQVDASSLDPKLECLADALGARDFRRYLQSLASETAALRCAIGLYDQHFDAFEHRVSAACGTSVMTLQQCFDLLTLDCHGAKAISATGSDSNVLISQYPVLIQHCLDVSDPDYINVSELLALLSTLPPARETLMRFVFEQITDVRRGDGVAPPPDAVRPHKLLALAKQSVALGHCTQTEYDAVAAWLETYGATSSASVSLRAFTAFHVHVSDVVGAEDAVFVQYVQRMWRFDAQVHSGRSASADLLGAYDLGIAHVLQSYATRCQLTTASRRKRELISKTERALSGHVHTRHALTTSVAALEALQLDRVQTWQRIDSDAMLSAQCATMLTGLRVLVLAGQHLVTLPPFITNLAQLEALDLSDNRLTTASFDSLDTAFAALAALRELRLRGNRIAALPRAVTALPSLLRLDLAANAMQTLAPAVVVLWRGRCRLETLDVSDNALTRVPDEIVVIAATLQQLLLHSNRLSALPVDALARMQQLTHLTLSHNALGRDDSNTLEMSVPPMLQHIALDHNALRVFPHLVCSSMQRTLEIDATTVPRTLEGDRTTVHRTLEGDATTTQLTGVFAGWNRLRCVPAAAFDGAPLRACVELDLQHNRLRELPDALFIALPALRVCRLNNNALTALPATLATCRQLRVLDVQHNGLVALAPALVQLTHLVALHANDNRLSNVPTEWHAFASFCDDDNHGNNHDNHCNHGNNHDNQNRMGNRIDRNGQQQQQRQERHERHEHNRCCRRRLQTLSLRRNPIANRVLRTLIDGSSVDASAAALASVQSSDEQICATAISKIIDALLYALDVLALETETERRCGSDDDSNDDDKSIAMPTRRWKGVTRNVVTYLERKLQTAAASNATKTNAAALIVSARAFRRLVASLPSTCSEQELASLVAHFSVQNARPSTNGSAAVATVNSDATHSSEQTSASQSRDATVSGAAFLYAVDRFGQHRTLASAPAAARSSFSMHKPSDTVAGVLHYLAVLHTQGVLQPQQRASPSKPLINTRDFVQLNRKAVQTRPPAARASPQPPVATAASSASTSSSDNTATHKQHVNDNGSGDKQQQHKALVRRQQQRIAILEQQLVDQKLLQLSRKQQAATTRSQLSLTKQLAPPSSLDASDDDSDDDSDQDDTHTVTSQTIRPAKTPANSRSRSDRDTVVVRMQCARGQEHLSALQRWRKSNAALGFAVALDARVLDVKQHIERATHIAVAHQVLLAPTTTAATRSIGATAASVRMRNDATVREYIDMTTRGSWCVTLLVSERLDAPVDLT